MKIPGNSPFFSGVSFSNFFLPHRRFRKIVTVSYKPLHPCLTYLKGAFGLFSDVHLVKFSWRKKT